MITVDALQGSQEWLAVRAKPNTFTASEAPAMKGDSKYTPRAALLKQKAIGIAEEVDGNKQRLFDRGHAAEADARPLVEAIIGESLYPVTGTLEIDGMILLASFDGLTAMDDIVWETKLWNASLADAVRAGQLDPHYYWQLEQQLLVSGAERAYFTCTDGTPENTVGMWYESLPDRRAALIAGWKQFAEDLANYQHVEQTVAAVAAPIEALPALAVTVSGSISLTHNLERFGQRLSAFVGGLNSKPETDQDFADLDAAVKVLKEAETALDSAEKNALAQTTTIADMCGLVEMYRKVARDNRLMFEKIVKQEKINRKAAIISQASMALAAHITALNSRLGASYMPTVSGGFTEAVSGLKSLDSMRDKVLTALANSKIASNEIADTIEANIKAIPEAWKFLFADMAQICTKPGEDFARLAESRIAAHKAAEAEKAEAAKKAEDARVAAAVEAERLAGEARAIEAARAATAEAERISVGVAFAEEEAAKAAQPAALDQSKQSGTVIQPQSVALAPEEKRAVVVEAQDDIAAFMNARDFGKDAGKIRAALVEFVKFQTERGLKAAA